MRCRFGARGEKYFFEKNVFLQKNFFFQKYNKISFFQKTVFTIFHRKLFIQVL